MRVESIIVDPQRSVTRDKGVIPSEEERVFSSIHDETAPIVSVTDTDTSTSIIPSGNHSSLLLARIAQQGKEKYLHSKQFLPYAEFLNEVEGNPVKYFRPVARYILDAMDYWDKVHGIKPTDKIKVMGKEVHPFAFARKPWEPKELLDKECVEGQLIFWNDLYDKLQLIARKKHPNRVIIVHGPNATGKSRVFETLFQMLEEYSKTEEGALYTYEWVFGGNSAGGEMGFRISPKKKCGQISRDEIDVSIPAGKNANPIFILPKQDRVELLNRLSAEGKIPPEFNKDYIISNGMNDLSRRVYEALWNYYEGDVESILNHVHVVRWTYSAQGRRGLVLIQPEVTPNTRLEPITPTVDWSALPRPIMNAFSTAGLHVMEGDEANANHGVIVFDDMFKDAAHGAQQHGSMDHFLYLLRFAEKARTTVSATTTKGRGAHAIDEQFDILLFGTTNDDTLMQLQENYSEWDSLNTRFEKSPLWFDRRYRDISELFKHQLRQLIPEGTRRHVSPHILNTFGLWLTMTYLFPSKNHNYYQSLDSIHKDVKPRLIPLLQHMSMLEKALLYQGEDLNSFAIDSDSEKPKYVPEEKAMLERHVWEIANEYNLGVGKHKFFFYEGSTGLPTRVAETIFERAVNAKPNECFSVVDLFDTLEDEIRHGFEFEQRRDTFLKNTAQRISEIKKAGGSASAALEHISVVPEPPSTKALLDEVKAHEKRQIRFEVYQALGCMKSREEQLHSLKKYIEHVIAYIAKRPVKTGWEDPEHNPAANIEFMQRMEVIFEPLLKKFSNINTPTYESFRLDITKKAGSWATNPDRKGMDLFENLEHKDLFPNLVEQMISYDIKANKEIVEHFLSDLRVYYERGKDIKSHNMAELEPERARLLEKGLKNLREKGYCDKCIPKILYFAFQEQGSYTI